MKKIAVILSILLISGCADMAQTREPANKTTLHLDEDYQAAYRIITKSILNECLYLPNTIQTTLFQDIESATISQSESGVTFWSMDIKKTGDKTSDMEFYTTFNAQKNRAYRAQKHINLKKSGCVFDDI